MGVFKKIARKISERGTLGLMAKNLRKPTAKRTRRIKRRIERERRLR